MTNSRNIFSKDDNYFIRTIRTNNGTCLRPATEWYEAFYIQRELDNKVLTGTKTYRVKTGLVTEGIWENHVPNCMEFETKEKAINFINENR